MNPTVITVDLTKVEASYVPHAIGLLGHVSQNQGEGLDTLQARHAIEWDGVTIVTVTAVKWLKVDHYQLDITFEHGGERNFNFFANYPELRELLKNSLAASGWRMRMNRYDLNKGLENVVIVPL